MKFISLLAILPFAGLQICAAVPHRHVRKHEQLHTKKDIALQTVTDYATVTVDGVTGPEVIVWVNEQGQVVSTETRKLGFSTTTAIPAPTTSSSASITNVESSSSLLVAPSTSSIAPAVAQAPGSSSTSTIAPPAPSTTVTVTTESMPSSTFGASSTSDDGNAHTVSPQASAAPGDVGSGADQGGGGELGMAYDILDDSGKCKSASTVESDFAAFSGFSMVRIYGVTCSQVALITSEAAKQGMKVLVSLNDFDNLAANLASIITQAGSNLDVIDTIGIGNEYVNNGGAVSDVVAALSTARSVLAATAFKSSIVTVDTFDALLQNPQLCQNSDYCAANCHAFFDDQIPAAGAGAYVLQQQQAVSASQNGKRTVITESGWPWQGQANGAAVPSIANQQAAIASLKSHFSQDLYLFEAFDAGYRAPGDFGVEPYWGIFAH